MATQDFINELKKGANSNRLGKFTIYGTIEDTPILVNQNNYLNSMTIKDSIANNGQILGGVFDKTLDATLVNKPNSLILEGKSVKDVAIGIQYKGKECIDELEGFLSPLTQDKYITGPATSEWIYDEEIGREVYHISRVATTSASYPQATFEIPMTRFNPAGKNWAIVYRYKFTTNNENQNYSAGWIGFNGRNNWEIVGVNSTSTTKDVRKVKNTNGWQIGSMRISKDNDEYTRFGSSYTKMSVCLGSGNTAICDLYVSDILVVEISDEEYANTNYDSAFFEYVPFDNFIIENIDDSETESTTTFTAYGSGAKLDEPYNCTLDFSNSATHTVYEFYEDVCDQLGLTPTDATITNGTIVATNNPFTNKESCRTVLEAIEKVSCSLVDIDWKNQTISLKWFSDTLDYEFDTSDYSALEGSLLKYGPINTVIIGNSQVTGENVSQTDSASVEANGETQIMIDEPYFLYTQALRTQALPAIFEILDGFEYDDIKVTTPYGKPFLKTGDKIKVNAPNGNVYNGYVMTHTITYNGAIQSIIESPALNKEERKMLNNINSSSIQNRLRRTELIVDKQNGEITALTSKTEQLEESIEVLSASLDTNIVIVSVNDSGYPFDNKTYEIDYSVKYLGEPLLSGYTISTSDSHTGITTNLSTLGKIKFTVANNTAITSEDNKYTFTISYTNSGTTYTSIRTVMVSTLVSEAEQNVIISALEPSDTSVLWYDLTDGILKKYNPIVFTYELTSDTTFGEAKEYYEKVDDEYIPISYDSSTQKYTMYDGTVYSVGDTIPANTIYIQNMAGGDWSKVNSADAEIQNVTDMITGQDGLQSKYDDLESRLQDAEHDLTNKVDSNTFNEYKSEVIRTQTNYYTKDEINQIATGEGVDGVTVTAVISTTATFDKDGMHYQKSTGDTISTINYEGMSVGDKNNNELFFAGVRDGESKSIVQTSNLKSDTYIIFGNSKGRLQEFTDPQANKTGVGLFLI